MPKAQEGEKSLLMNACSMQVECKGQVQVNWGKCNEKSRPMLGPNTLKQIDIFIFVIASMHVLCGVLLICSVNLRVWVWTKKTAVETGRDPYTTRLVTFAPSQDFKLGRMTTHPIPNWNSLYSLHF